jgi:hypothetical protein
MPRLFYSSFIVVFGALAYGGVHRVADPTVHSLQHVAVGVERLRYRSVP